MTSIPSQFGWQLEKYSRERSKQNENRSDDITERGNGTKSKSEKWKKNYVAPIIGLENMSFLSDFISYFLSPSSVFLSHPFDILLAFLFVSLGFSFFIFVHATLHRLSYTRTTEISQAKFLPGS